MYFLEWACTVQVRTLSMGRLLHDASSEVVSRVSAHRKPGGSALAREFVWPALLRKLDRASPGWDA
jgi:hypothetical protein